jgi:hypothetical protein
MNSKIRTAVGLIRLPERVVAAMEKNGVEVQDTGVVLIFPLSEFGVPMMHEKPTTFERGIDSAVSQTAHVKDSLDEKIASGKRLLDGMTRVRTALKDGNTESAQTTFTSDVSHLIPSQKSRTLALKDMRANLLAVPDFISSGDTKSAIAKLVESTGLLEPLLDTWAKQKIVWRRRRLLLMAVRNMLRKQAQAPAVPSMTEYPMLVGRDQQVAHRLVKLAKALMETPDKE